MANIINFLILSGGGNNKGAKTIYDSLSSAGFDCNPFLKAFYNSSSSGVGNTLNPSIEKGDTRPYSV